MPVSFARVPETDLAFFLNLLNANSNIVRVTQDVKHFLLGSASIVQNTNRLIKLCFLILNTILLLQLFPFNFSSFVV